MLSPDELAALATPVFGSEWQSALARARGVAIRTVQRWAKDGIHKPETAVAIRAYLLSRRVIDLPPPLSQDDEERDDAAHLVAPVLLDTILDAGAAVGWHDAELLAAMLSAVVDRMIDGAGVPATVETLKAAMAQARRGLDR